MKAAVLAVPTGILLTGGCSPGRADPELKESGMKPFRLARVLLGPLES